MNYREAGQRFAHIDAEFVGCEIGLPDKDSFFTVRFYAWWEHPLYLEARDAETAWGFSGLAEAQRLVTVYPRGIHQVHLSRSDDVTDWDFTQDHPLLWQYEQSGEITCNSPMSLEQWMEISKAAQGRLTGDSREDDLTGYLQPERIYRYGKSGSFSLGQFPRPLYLALRQELDAQGISHFAQHEPRPVELPVLFLIDGNDYIIADDFQIDVPDFTHRPEWFQPYRPEALPKD